MRFVLLIHESSMSKSWTPVYQAGSESRLAISSRRKEATGKSSSTTRVGSACGASDRDRGIRCQTSLAQWKKQPADQLANAAVKDAIDGASTEEEKEALALELFREATGFPQASSDRRAVFTGGFWLVGIVFLVTAGLAVVLILNDKEVPDWLSTFATALVSAVLGGLFGYAKQ